MEGKSKKKQESEVVRALVQATQGKFWDWPVEKRIAVVNRAMALLEDEAIWASVSR